MPNYYNNQSHSQSYSQQPAPAQEVDREIGWDEEFSGDIPEWVLLPEGDYPFRVESMERVRFNGADWLPACWTAVLTIRLFGEQETTLKHTLYLHTKRLYAMKHFFVAIGQAREDDSVIRPRWQEVPGSEGMCHVTQRTYTKKDGTEGRANRIQRFLPPAPAQSAPKSAPAPAQSAVPAPGAYQQQTVTGYAQQNPGHWSGNGF